jgi:hypothetical protein
MRKGPVPVPREAVPNGGNPWGIPELLLPWCWRGRLPEPVAKWGTLPRRSALPRDGTYQFYTDDYKFSGLWSFPNSVRDSGVRVLVEPNYSTSPGMALAEVLWRLYKKRFLARYWQEHLGLHLVVDLGVDLTWKDYTLVGVPPGWTSYATRWYGGETREEDIMEDYRLARDRAGPYHPPDFHLFGGAERGKALAGSQGWYWYSKGMKSKWLSRRITKELEAGEGNQVSLLD